MSTNIPTFRHDEKQMSKLPNHTCMRYKMLHVGHVLTAGRRSSRKQGIKSAGNDFIASLTE